MQDIRWQQRFNNFTNALQRLQEAVELSKQRELSLLELQGLIKAFEFSHELAWNVMKDYLTFQGIAGIIGSRGAIREAFKVELISDGNAWMDTLKSRNETIHTYNQALAHDIAKKIIETYYPLFKTFKSKMDSLEI